MTEERRPTEAECWATFGEGIATIWVTLPPEVQREYARRYPPAARQAAETGDGS